MTKIKRLIPNLLTAGNLVGGILAIIFSLTGRIDLAPWCIFASAIFDFLDGFAARLLNVQNELGKQLDSLADMVTFGVAPGVIVMVMLGTWDVDLNTFVMPTPADIGDDFISTSYYISDVVVGPNIMKEQSSGFIWMNLFNPFWAFLIPVFALFRLAKFNLDTRQISSFIGLPTPAMTLFFAVIPLLVLSGVDGEVQWQQSMVSILINPFFLVASTIVMSIMMVVELPLFALKFNGFKWKGNEIRFIFLTICIGLFATLLFWSVPLIIILYIILSVINNVINKTNEI